MPRAKKQKSTALVQITKSQIPPLRQSTQETMGCPRFYAEVFIKGRKVPGGLDAARGTEIHRTMAAYLSHCARKGVGMDLDSFDQFSHGAGSQAARILSGLRDGFVVDHEHLFATEISMALDENFQPTDAAPEIEGISGDSGLEPHYQGTLDGLYVFRSDNRILIDDFKSHARPFEPADKPQGKEYSLFAFQHFPWVETVMFRLVFVRYRNVVRSVTYTRQDIPKLIEELKAARERQKMIHQNYDAGNEIEAIPGSQCPFCPLLGNRDCPVAEFNSNMQLTPEEWVKFDLWYSAFSRVNRSRMKDHVQKTGKPIILRDYNQKVYLYGPVESESNVFPLFRSTSESIATKCACGGHFDYVPENGLCPQCNDGYVRPLMPIVDMIVEDYAFGNTGDTKWMGNLVISSTKLNSYLGAKKRAFLDQRCQDTADKITKVKMQVSKPLDSIPEEETSEDGDEWGEDSEF